MNWEQKINALTVQQLILIAVALAAAILIVKYRSQIQSALQK